MLRSPLHLLISLHRFLLRSKARHRSGHPLFRPIMKTTSWSAGIISKIPNMSSPVLTKHTPTLEQQHEQTNQLFRMIHQHSTSTTRRLLLHRRSHRNGYAWIQRRTMVSSGSSNGGSHISTILNANHFFTARPSILGVHGTPLLPPPPPASFQSYSIKSPWNLRQQQQRHLIIPCTSTNNDTGDNEGDNDYVGINTRLHRMLHPRLLSNPSKTDNNFDNGRSGNKQRSYRPPDMRGMADLMENNNDDCLGGSTTRHSNDTNNNNTHSGCNGNKVYHPGLVHRGQSPRRMSSQQTQATSSSATPKTMLTPPVDVLRHDDLSLQTSKKRSPYGAAIDTNSSGDKHSQHQQQQWYISIPMDLTSYSHDNNTTSSSSSALQHLIFMESAVSILDPTWLACFDTWGKLVREHLTKVMVFIQLIGLEAQRYATTKSLNDNKRATTTMDFKMMMKKSDTSTELHIYLPHQLFTPLPATRNNIQHWINQLTKEPPRFEIKCLTTRNNSMDGVATMDNDTSPLNTLASGYSVNELGATQMDDDDLVMVPSTVTETDQGLANNDSLDDTTWHIGPRYFQGIHTFLNHVDSMIDSSPAFTTTQTL